MNGAHAPLMIADPEARTAISLNAFPQAQQGPTEAWLTTLAEPAAKPWNTRPDVGGRRIVAVWLDEEMKMKTHSFQARTHVWFGLALAGLVAATCMPLTARGAKRVVLGEYFNATW